MNNVASEEIAVGKPAAEFMAVLAEALSTRSQLGWSQWLQGEIQGFLPHDALIAAWGDFATGELAYDVITRSPALSTDFLPQDIIEPLMGTLFDKWLGAGQDPAALDTRGLRSVGSSLFAFSPCALVHGVQDRRSRYDCLYVFVGPASLASPFSRQLCRMALPYIDTAFRQVADRGQTGVREQMSETGFASSRFADGPLGGQAAAAAIAASAQMAPDWGRRAAGEPGSALSARELEVMKWVRMGKTNSEIAIILNLSTFTVKNHMRRIYRKLDVLNRAQAVGSLDSVYATAGHATPDYARR